jgi:hypothetical protein
MRQRNNVSVATVLKKKKNVSVATFHSVVQRPGLQAYKILGWMYLSHDEQQINVILHSPTTNFYSWLDPAHVSYIKFIN